MIDGAVVVDIAGEVTFRAVHFKDVEFQAETVIADTFGHGEFYVTKFLFPKQKLFARGILIFRACSGSRCFCVF